MSIFTTIEHLFIEAETDVVALVAKAKNGLTLAAHDVNIALVWIANNTPQIAKDLTMAESLIVSTGVANDPRVAAAIVSANLAMVGLNAFSASAKAGQLTPQSVVDGYLAVKQAQSAAAEASAAAASAPTAATGTTASLSPVKS